MPRYDTIIIGAGLAGLTTACYQARAGQKTLLISTGIGALLLASGSIDVLGYQPVYSKQPLDSPWPAWQAFCAEWPQHPYNLWDVATTKAALHAFQELVAEQNLPYHHHNEKNWFLPGPGGAIHPTALAPASMIAGDVRAGGQMLVVGFAELRDFYPALLCDNLNAQKMRLTAKAVTIQLPSPLSRQENITPLELASAFEDPAFRAEIIRQIKPTAKGYSRIGFPAVLGVSQHQQVMDDLQTMLGKPVFEISTLPPSVPGRRLYEALKSAFQQAGGQMIIGSKVIGGHIEHEQVQQIQFETVTRPKTITARQYILATGGIFGGGLNTDSAGNISEAIFNLPVTAPAKREDWFEASFIAPAGHAINQAGIRVNKYLNPLSKNGKVIAKNLFIIGNLLYGPNWIMGRTGNGVALTSAFQVAKENQTNFKE